MKTRLYTALLLLLTIAGVACTPRATTTTSSEWTRQQRQQMRRTLLQYRDMVYIDEMTDAEFIIFANNVTDEIEYVYPLYTEFIEFPAVSDSIDMYVTTTIVEQLDADGANIRHIYPYRQLRRESILPEGLSRKELRAYYKCLARKINSEYSDFSEFFAAVVANTTNKGDITKLQAECAMSLFNYKSDI